MFLDGACVTSAGTWDSTYIECTCLGLYYRNALGYCTKMKQDNCIGGDGVSWSSTSGCVCDETKGYYFDLGKCITAKTRCENSIVGAIWEPTSSSGDDDFESTKYTVGSCKCPSTYLDDNGACKLASLVCTESNGTWKDSRCLCPNKYMEVSGKCVVIPESAEKTRCEADTGIWNPSSTTCDCGASREWDGASCIPACGKGKYWTGLVCTTASESEADAKVKCSLEKHHKFNLLSLIYFLFIPLAISMRRYFKLNSSKF